MRTVFLEQVTSAAMQCLASLLRSHTATLEGTVSSDGHNLMRTVFLEQVMSAAMQCLASLLRSHTATNRSQGKLFHVLPTASRTGSKITFYNSLFFVKEQLFETGLMNTKETLINAES